MKSEQHMLEEKLKRISQMEENIKKQDSSKVFSLDLKEPKNSLDFKSDL